MVFAGNDKLSHLQLLRPADARVSFKHVNEVCRLIGGLGTLSGGVARRSAVKPENLSVIEFCVERWKPGGAGPLQSPPGQLTFIRSYNYCK